MLCKLVLVSGVAMAAAALPATAQQGQPQMPMMGHGMMMGGQGMHAGHDGWLPNDGRHDGRTGHTRHDGPGNADDGVRHAGHDGDGMPMVRSGHDGIGLGDPAS
jgi:hypothetical protein